jgi:hypothetical protein
MLMRLLCASALTLTIALAAQANAQTSGRANAPVKQAAPAKTQSAAARVVPLPTSDVVLAADLRRIFNEAVPRVFAGDPARLAQVNADIERFKARTGIDPRAFDTLTVGARLTNTPTRAVKIDNPVAVVTGRFDINTLTAAARAAAKGGLTEQRHGGKTVYVMNVNDELRLFGLLKMRVRELAFAALDAGTLAVGEPASVRATLDAAAGRGRADAALVNGARVGGDALVAFAGNVPAGTFAGVDTGLPNVNRSIESIRGFSGNVGMTAAGYQMTTALRAANAADAKQLADTLLALKSIAPGFISVAGERAKFAERVVNSTKITTQGAETQLRFDLTHDDLAALLRVL